MALSAKVSNIVNPGATGAQATNTVGFQPKALLFFGGRHTATGELADVHWQTGIAGTAAEDINFYHNSDDVVAASDVVRSFLTNTILKTTVAGAATAATTATLTSMDVSGFTLNFTARAANEITSYLALGGDLITDAVAGTLQLNTVTGNQSVTTLSFQPDIVFFFTSLISSGTGTANNQSAYCIGAATSSSDRWYATFSAQNAQAAANTHRGFSNTKCLAVQNVTTNSLSAEADFVSMDSNGFTINITTSATSYQVGYLAIRGGNWKAGTFQQPNNTTGNYSVSGLGFKPSGALFASTGMTATGVDENALFTMGAATSSSERQSYWVGDLDASLDMVAKSHYKTDKVIQFRTPVSTGSTLNAEADYVSNDSDGFTINWTTCDTNQRYIGYVAFGESLPVVNLYTPSDTATVTDTTPDLTFDSNNPSGNDVRYNVQIDTVNTFNSTGGNPLINAVSGTDAGFSGSPDNTDPFTSGQTVTYTVQSALPDTTTYYFDGSDGAIVDNIGVWTDDANAFDGSTATSASTNNRTATAWLKGEGTNSPTTGTEITQVRARIYADDTNATMNAVVYTDGQAQSLGNPSGPSEISGWGDYITLSTPTGGWTWQVVSDLEAVLDLNGLAGASGSISRVEVEVTSLSPLPSGTYYWRVRALAPSGTNAYGGWATTRSFTVDTGGGPPAATVKHLGLLGVG